MSELREKLEEQNIQMGPDGLPDYKASSADQFLAEIEAELKATGEMPATIKDQIQAKALALLKEKNLPDSGDSKFWVDNSIADKTPENPDKPEFKIMSWNLERGLRVEDQIKYLQEQDPDVLCVQEIDWDCDRTGNRNITLEMAKALGYKYILYTTEFVEVNDETIKEARKNPNTHGGGVHGQAILSRYPLQDPKAFKLTNAWHDWEDASKKPGREEPRRGQRVAQMTDIQIGNKTITVVNTHFENHGGLTGRLVQWDEVKKRIANSKNPVMVMGDLNTTGHGVANLVQHDNRKDLWRKMRDESGKPIKRFGEEEGAVWMRDEFEPAGFKTAQSPDQISYRLPPAKFAYDGKLDWMLYRDGQVGKFNLKESTTGPDRMPGMEKDMSDHRPLIAKLEIE
ncbi:MAG: endonuclease/exonuclease/phosphatase family protein [Patescibacteria group bacterium]